MARVSRLACSALVLSAALLAQNANAAEPTRSGPQVEEKVPGAFKVLNLNGPDAGKLACIFCRNGSRPMVMIFAREMTPAVTSLLLKLEAAAADPNSSLNACVIFCSDDPGVAGRLAPWVTQMKLNKVTVAVGSAAGPAKYNLAPEAAVTVLMYSHFKVQANHAFRAGELQDVGVAAILADLPKILSR